MSRRAHSVEEVVQGGLCTGCGLCASIAGPRTITMKLNACGYVRPQVRGQVPADVNRRILRVCPGVEVGMPRDRPGVEVDPVWGALRELHRSWAVEERVRHKAAAGGTLTALGRYLLDSGEVEAIVHVRASREHPMLSDGLVSRTAEEVLSGAQSRYGPVAPLVPVRSLLEEGVRFALIAKPCDVSALRRLALVDRRVDELVPYMLTMFCGGVQHAQIPRRISRYHGFDGDEVSLFRFRGEGWPGMTRIETRDGRAAEMTYDETWHDERKPWRPEPQFRCKICPDAIGEAADLAAPDGWIVENGHPVYREAPGVNALVIRTEAGARLVRAAVDAGYLRLRPLAIEELAPMHGNHVTTKLAGPARRLALMVSRGPHLGTRGARSLRLLRRAGPRLTIAEFKGTLRRIRAGANREPSP